MSHYLYLCHTVHSRNLPKAHHFGFRHFLFGLDLDKLSTLNDFRPFIGTGAFNWYRYRSHDHYFLNKQDPKKSVIDYLNQQDLPTEKIDKIILLANVRTLGFVFNPISLYLCLDQQKNLVYTIAEVTNTFWEQKLFVVNRKLICPKYFYVSPFMDLDAQFRFEIKLSHEQLAISVDSINSQGHGIYVSMKASPRLISRTNLLYSLLRYPLMPHLVWMAIHWQAFKLWRKKIPYLKKKAQPHLQQEILYEKSDSIPRTL